MFTDGGRTLFVRRIPDADVALLLRLCAGACEVLTLVERAKPVGRVAGEEDAVEGVRLRPVSVAVRREACVAELTVLFPWLSGLEDGLLCVD